MIARLWRGKASTDVNATAYEHHVSSTVFPSLKDLEGHRGAMLLRREVAGGTEFLAVTLWQSRRSIEAFTGPDIGIAIVEPQGRAVLSAFDDFAHHYDVVAQAPATSAAAQD
jgi:heme-degrading monooxygenase HmoA